MKKILLAIIIVIAIFTFFISKQSNIEKIMKEEVIDFIQNQNISENNTETINGITNPNFPYFTSIPITYKISDLNSCGKAVERRIYEAFEIIRNKTLNIVYFQQNNYSALIEINCFGNINIKESGFYTAGEGGPTSLQERKIIGGKVNLYNAKIDNFYSGGCRTYPDVELHEIMHVFGFDHIDWKKKRSIMHDGSGLECAKLDKEIIECLKNIYSNGKEGSSCQNLPSLTHPSNLSTFSSNN